MDNSHQADQEIWFGPSIFAIPLHGQTSVPQELLSADERRRLALMASIQRFEAGEFLFHEGDAATTIFNVISGVTKSVALLEDGRQAVLAFFFAHDLVGMFENSHYAHSAQAVTPVTAYSLPVNALERLLRRDPNLQLHFLCKVSHDLRTAQRQAIILGKFDATQKIVLFLDFLDRHPDLHERIDRLVTIPMDRADIADYLGLRIESVSRVLQKLHRDGIIRVDGRHRFQVTDQAAFDRIVDGAISRAAPGTSARGTIRTAGSRNFGG